MNKSCPSVLTATAWVALLCGGAFGDGLPAASDATSVAPSVGLAGDGDFAEPADQRVEVKNDGRLDVRLREVPVFDALEMLSEQTHRNIVVENGVQGQVSLVLRQVTFEEALRAIARTNNLSFEMRDGIIYVSQPKPDAKPEAVQAGLGPEVEPEIKVFKLNYVTAVSAEEFIKPMLDASCVVTRSGEVKEGIESDKESTGGFSSAGSELLVIMAPPTKMRMIELALREYDTRPPQVLVEATIMRATLNDQNALGIDFNTLLGVDLQMLNATSPGVTDLAVGNIPFDRLDNFNSTLRTDFADRVPGGGFTFGIVKDQIAAFVRALEQITDVTIMANPKLLVLNKQRGEVIVGRRDGYQTTTVTETAAIQTVEYLETGTKLIFRPFVTGAGDVRMEIHPEDSNGGLTAANLPFQETTEATTNILLKNGHTILIGGLFRERTNATKSQVPVIGNVPVLGHLFGVQQDQSVREEVIILLTVHVLTESEQEDARFSDVQEHIERVRVGARQGLMGTGREVLAESRYRRALDELREGAVDKALESVRASLQLNPHNLDAIQLREELENKRTWRATGTQMRTFLHEMLREEQGMPGRPVLGMPNTSAMYPDTPVAPADSSGGTMREASPHPRVKVSPRPPLFQPPSPAPSAPRVQEIKPMQPARVVPAPRSATTQPAARIGGTGLSDEDN